MNKLFENWNSYLNERGNPSESRFREAVVDFIVGQMKTMGMSPGEESDRMMIQKETHAIVDLAIEQLGLAQEEVSANDSELTESAEADPFSDRLSLSRTIRDAIVGHLESEKAFEMGAIPQSVIEVIENSSLRIADAVTQVD